MKCRNCKHPRWAEEYPGRPFFGWCDEINDSPDMDIERECRWFEPATNADVIRRMSDEELAKFIATPCQCEVMPKRDGSRECGNDLCLQYLLKWLRQPAEETPDGH